MEPRPVINIEEHIGKVVGRRRPHKDPLLVSNSTKAMAMDWMQALPVKMPKKGVFRFLSHEEAARWMTARS